MDAICAIIHIGRFAAFLIFRHFSCKRSLQKANLQDNWGFSMKALQGLKADPTVDKVVMVKYTIWRGLISAPLPVMKNLSSQCADGVMPYKSSAQVHTAFGLWSCIMPLKALLLRFFITFAALGHTIMKSNKPLPLGSQEGTSTCIQSTLDII